MLQVVILTNERPLELISNSGMITVTETPGAGILLLLALARGNS